MASGIIKKAPRTLRQQETVNVTGNPSDWVYVDVVFNIPYESAPLVVVHAPYDTGSSTNWYPAMVKNITSTGFTFGWYNVTGSKTVLWQAIGII